MLRSIRYGEADRVLHLYTPHRGRVGAIAKGVRRARSRFGGRLEPFFRLRLVLHEGRGDLLTVTSAETVAGHPRLRESGPALDVAARACDAVARLFETEDPHPPVYHLLCNELALLDAEPERATRRQRARLPAQAAARRRPDARSWPPAPPAASASTWWASPAPPAAWCAPPARRAPSRSTRRRTTSSSRRSGARWREAPDASPRALRQAERAIIETVEHHAHVRLRAVESRA